MARKKITGIFFLFICVPLFAAQNRSRLEVELQRDISDSRLDHFSPIEAAFILSGATDPDSLQFYLEWYNELIETLRSFHLDPFDQIGSAAKVFQYLHATWLKNYREEATTLLDVVNQRRYNCVAGTILFNLVCDELGWPTEAFETPTHTYTIFPTFTRQLMVENTSSMGFDMMKNLRLYNRYLLQFYPEKQALNIGLDRMYAYENSKGRKITNTELLGLLAYNRAYFARETNDFQAAYNFVILAQSFNNDSRSNIQFEIDLYYRWGKELFQMNNYTGAFEVFADAFYRYPDITNFQKNCRISFFNAQIQTWSHKDWTTSRQIIQEMFALEILKPVEQKRLEKMLIHWANYFYQQNLKKESHQLIEIWNQLDPNEPKLRDFKRAVTDMGNDGMP